MLNVSERVKVFPEDIYLQTFFYLYTKSNGIYKQTKPARINNLYTMQAGRPIYKNQWYFYTLKMNSPKVNWEKNSFITASKHKLLGQPTWTKEVQNIYWKL